MPSVPKSLKCSKAAGLNLGCIPKLTFSLVYAGKARSFIKAKSHSDLKARQDEKLIVLFLNCA